MRGIEKIIEEVKAGILPFESWLQLKGESAKAYSAFCVFRDCGAERSVKTAFDAAEKDGGKRQSRYGTWRNWCSTYRWNERAADYDRYIEQLKQGELRKTIEAQGEKHREVTGKMLDVVSKKLDAMNPQELTQGNLTEWVQAAIKAEREAAGLVTSGGKAEPKQGELNFVPDFNGL